MSSEEIRKKFLEFFKERGHAIVPSSSLIPDDPSVLLTTAGMQQFKRYYTGELDAKKDFKLADDKPAKGVVSIQKCFRTSDIDEVGDESHLTFFEMLGNFSFGGYFKEDAIRYAYEFITDKKWMGLPIDYVSVFKGDKDMPSDEESEKIWKAIDPTLKVVRAGREDNFWGPTGPEGPCGPTTEIYCKNGSGKPIETWNIVFNEYYRRGDGTFEKLKTPGVDTGMGLERLAMVAQKTGTLFETDLFQFIFRKLLDTIDLRTKRIFSDHLRGIAFLISDGVRPSNKDAGYVLRRLIRRVVVYEEHVENIRAFFSAIAEQYGQFYPELKTAALNEIFTDEHDRFSRTLKKGLEELKKTKEINAQNAFQLYQSFGLPFEIIKERGGDRSRGLTREDFDREFAKHQEISRAGAEKKFGGHGLILNTGELKAGNEEEMKKAVRLHTATHLCSKRSARCLGRRFIRWVRTSRPSGHASIFPSRAR